MSYKDRSKQELMALQTELEQEYQQAKKLNLSLDMSRGKPSTAQLKISEGLLSTIQNAQDIIAQDGTNCGNYGALHGIDEARRLMADILDVRVENVFVGGNSSLNLMHDCVSFAFVHGFPQSDAPWCGQKVKFLCPSPGYDRHFAISQHFGMELIQVEMTPQGPDMNQVEELIKDPLVKGMWCVPKYSNPTGITYSDEVVARLATMKPAAADFKVFWDNAYSVHHLDKNSPDVLLDFMAELEKAGNQDRALMFSSTSKITFPGGGISAIAASKSNLAWLSKHMSLQTISYDKLNQLRHAKFFPNPQAVAEHMEKHAEMLKPKFQIVMDELSKLEGLEITSWEKPVGGYFISLDVLDGCAKREIGRAHV